jgi:hypothetical protein
VYTVLYLCNYRPHWYDDLPPYADFGTAANVANSVAAQRRTVANVYDPWENLVYQADYR